jgi:hypothetical protein
VVVRPHHGEIVALEAMPDRDGSLREAHFGQASRREVAREVDEGERIPARLHRDPDRDDRIDRLFGGPADEGDRGGHVESGEPQLRESGEQGVRRGVVAEGDEQEDRLRVEPPRDERERPERLGIEQMGVVDDHDHGSARRALGDEGEERESD